MKYNRLNFTFFLLLLYAGVQAQSPKPLLLQVDKDAINFILMGDWGRNGEDHQKEVAAQMGKVAANASVDFIIAAGDNFYPRGVASEHDPLWKYSFEDIYTAFSLQWDWYPVLGNHDYGANPEAQIKYSAISRRWQMPARYYSRKFSIQGDTTNQLLIAFIDTCPLIPYYYNGNSHAVHDQDSTAQKVWLKKLFQENQHVKWKLVVGHHPMFTGGSRTENADTRAVRGSLLPMLQQFQIDAYLAGHEHSLQHIAPPGHVHHFISGAASEKTPARLLPTSKFAVSEYGFMLFSVKPNQLLVQVIDFTGKVLYATTLSK